MHFLRALTKTAQASCLSVVIAPLCYLPALHADTVDSFSCALELDASVALASNPDMEITTMTERFANLEKHCPGFAQLAHNQGVLAARADQWPEAIAHFKRALNMDQRAADTHRHLQQIFEYRAALAYARALDTPLNASPPAMVLQDSSIHNADIIQPAAQQVPLRDLATIEYELYAWWQAKQSWKGIRGHYIQNYDFESIKLARQQHVGKAWPDVKREIAFTENDAVIVLSDSVKAHTLLLMRLVGTRWKIYQETML